MGAILGELCLRVSGETIQDRFERTVRRPHDLEVWFGLPVELDRRAVDVRADPVDLPAVPHPQLADLLSASVLGDPPLTEVANTRVGRASGLPAAGAVASARGLAGAYAALGCTVDGVPSVARPATVARFNEVQSSGNDLVTGWPGNFGIVFQVPGRERPFASARAVGHDGAFGALGFWDPTTRISFGFTTDRAPAAGGERRADALALAAATALRATLLS